MFLRDLAPKLFEEAALIWFRLGKSIAQKQRIQNNCLCYWNKISFRPRHNPNIIIWSLKGARFLIKITDFPHFDRSQFLTFVLPPLLLQLLPNLKVVQHSSTKTNRFTSKKWSNRCKSYGSIGTRKWTKLFNYRDE